MSRISSKTIQDLEFNVVLEQAAAYCTTIDGKKNMLLLEPLSYRNAVKEALNHTHEYLLSFSSEYRIPNHGFDVITKELQLLRIENTYLETQSLKKLVSNLFRF